MLLPGFLLRMLRRGGYREKFAQRLGCFTEQERGCFRGRTTVWIHSISVGETFIALKLARALHQHDPAIVIALSVTTSTGFAEASKAAAPWLVPIYNPIDARFIVRRTLAALEPARIILIEGEAWPNLVAESYRRGIPMALANARLSPRSARRFLRFRSFTAPIFRMLDAFCLPDATDAPRWMQLDLDSARLHHTGSIKFDETSALPTRSTEFRSLLAGIGVSPTAPVIVGGSTWAPEEVTLARAFLTLRQTWPDLHLILVPRHVERTEAILRDLRALGGPCIRRSTITPNTPTTDSASPPPILLVDTTGELRDWYAIADVVFVGKSLPGVHETGGQNPAEPAALAKPIVIGPHTENFAALITHLREHQAIAEVTDEPSLTAQLATFLNTPNLRTEFGHRAQAALAPHRGATQRTLEILGFIPTRGEPSPCQNG